MMYYTLEITASVATKSSLNKCSSLHQKIGCKPDFMSHEKCYKLPNKQGKILTSVFWKKYGYIKNHN